MKCEQYWNEKLEDPYDAGRGITVTTTGYRTLADYEARDITVQCVSSLLSKIQQLHECSNRLVTICISYNVRIMCIKCETQ